MNRIILTFVESNTQIVTSIQEDFQVEAVTEFASFADYCPTISTLTDLANAVQGTGGTISQAGLSLRSIMDAPRWQKTNPIKVTTDMFFYTQGNAEKDVVDQVNLLYAAHLLTKGKNGIEIPGVNAKSVKDIENIIKGVKTESDLNKEQTTAIAKTADDITMGSKLFSVLIPGVVFIPTAFLFSMQATYSKQITDTGFPLWAQANVVLQGIAPAFADQFTQAKNYTYTGMEKKI